MTLREKLMHYTHDLDCDVDLKQEAVATIEHIAQYMDEDELLHHSRPLAIAYLALTEDASVPVVHGRMIDADKLVDMLYDNEFASLCPLDEVSGVIDACPTVDAVVVTRCKDCKHLCVWNRKDIYAFCPKTNIVFLPFDKDTRTFFCSLGERKDGGDG